MSSFAQLRVTLREWPRIRPEFGPLPELPYERLRLAVQTAKGSSDIACLVRQALRRETGFYGSEASITVPAKAPFPDQFQWSQHGCSARAVPGEAFEVTALPWNASWLKRISVREEVNHPFEAVEADQLRTSRDRLVRSDPALRSQFGLANYLSSAQAETIRSVLLSPPGSIQLVVLPTGGGKSLVGMCAGLLGPNDGGLSLFVVPTIALAHDQVKSARLLRPGDAIDAWESGLSTDDRAAIRDRIRSGTQRLLFASPESIVGSLANILIEVAERGGVRAFVIDEAHLVGQWGAAFRPEFQIMGAFWRYLWDRCPENRRFRTLLMTATLTEETYQDLDLFFGPIGPQRTLATVVLRQEPDYWEAKCDAEREKIDRITEILRHGPRPAILYVTKQEDAREWHERCLKLGWLRTGLVHGSTSSSDREKAITRWRDNNLDLMVATSAFGLGMDKGDVRLVLHACVPETVDRFYQEVGRGGRDGKPTVSITVRTEEDYRIGRRMSSAMLVSPTIGLERWLTMWESRKASGDDLFLLNIRKVRAGLSYDSDNNINWNMRTLLLLVRAGVLRIRYFPFQGVEKRVGEDEEEFRLRERTERDEYLATCAVQLLGDNNPLNQRTWNELVEAHRSESLSKGDANWRWMSDIIQGRASLISGLREMYKIPSIGVFSVGLDYSDAVSTPPIHPCDDIKPALAAAVIGQPRVPLLTYDPTQIKTQGRLIIEILSRLATLGVREFALPLDWIAAPKWFSGLNSPIEQIRMRSPEKFVIVRDIEEQDPLLLGRLPVPRVSLLGYSGVIQAIPDHLLVLDRPLHLILLPMGTPNREFQWRKVIDGPHIKIDDFYRLLNL